MLVAQSCQTLGLRESIPRQVDNNSGAPAEEKEVWGSRSGGREGSGILKEEQRTAFIYSTFHSLSHIKFFFFKPGTDDYTTNNSG